MISMLVLISACNQSIYEKLHDFSKCRMISDHLVIRIGIADDVPNINQSMKNSDFSCVEKYFTEKTD